MSRRKYFLLCLAFFLVTCFYITVKTCYFSPTTPKINLLPILIQNQLTDADYTCIYEQTGIAKPLYEELKTLPNFTEKMFKFQDDYLKKKNVSWMYLPPITIEERLVDEQGNFIPGFELGPYHNGYVLFTKAAHSLGWRHGHAGLVVDAVHGKTLEALRIGEGCCEQNISKWQYYPTFKMMRLKGVSLDKLNQIALYARENLKNATYHLLGRKITDTTIIPNETQCALLIWQAFYNFGYDLDFSNSLFVTPKSLASSPLLEILQNYGFDPKKVW